MGLILNIETATTVCSVVLARDGKVIALKESSEKNIHAAALQPFIDEVLKSSGTELADLDAVAVSEGPGSYTGLRIGVSAAKGLCYALDIPLIGVSSLQGMAAFAKHIISESTEHEMPELFCPMIDARRMEVYTAFYDRDLMPVSDVHAEILTEESFSETLEKYNILFTGNGSEKARPLLESKSNIVIDSSILSSAIGIAIIANGKLEAGDLADVAYFEPYYLKEFIAALPVVKGLR